MAESLLFETALKKAMALCAGREYCRSDIRQKLSTWSIDATDAEKIISKLVIEKFIDEERYCTAFVRDKFRYNKWGRVKIASALKMKKYTRRDYKQCPRFHRRGNIYGCTEGDDRHPAEKSQG